MRGVKFLLALFLVSALVVAFVSCRFGPPPLSVVVQDSLTGRPVPAARCLLGENEAQGSPSGVCSFSSWKPEQFVQISAIGYQGAQVALAALPSTGDIPEVRTTVVLTPDRIQGLVIDSYTGQPIAGAVVTAPEGSLQTDANGQFTVMTPTFPLALTFQAADHDAGQGTFATTTVRVSLRPNTLEGTVFDRETENPIAGAILTLTGSPLMTTTTDAQGRYRFAGVPEAFSLQADALMYRSAITDGEHVTHQDLKLRPAFLKGVVRDDSGKPVAKARVVYPGGWLHTDDQGKFLIPEVPEEVTLQVLSPGFAKQAVDVTDSASVTVSLKPFVVKGIYVTSYVASTTDWMNSLLDFVDQTELNAIVVEVKDARGAVAYDSQVPLVKELKTNDNRYDPLELIQKAHERGIYVIAYIVTFEDSGLADAMPDWAIHVAGGGLWKNNEGLRWTDPYRPEVWDYNIAIAKELAGMGVDEVQFDYVRFPTDGDTSIIRYAEETNIDKQYATIAGFIQHAYEELAPTGVFVSGDIFGYAAWRKMWEQGQDISLMTNYLDYLCPMSYPSHYSPGELGCANPNACPYEMVYETLKRGYAQLTSGQRAKLRSWLQDFDLGAPDYGVPEVEAQIKANQDGGGVGFCLWNAGNVYTQQVDYSPQ